MVFSRAKRQFSVNDWESQPSKWPDTVQICLGVSLWGVFQADGSAERSLEHSDQWGTRDLQQPGTDVFRLWEESEEHVLGAPANSTQKRAGRDSNPPL